MGVSSQFYSHGVVFHHVDWKPSQIKVQCRSDMVKEQSGRWRNEAPGFDKVSTSGLQHKSQFQIKWLAINKINQSDPSQM
jgi:hypothetical protein